MNKSEWRGELRRRREDIPPETARAASLAMAKHLERFLAGGPRRVIAGYFPFRGEIDTNPVMESLWNSNHIMAVPVVDKINKHLDFRGWNPGCAMQPGAYGIGEPLPDAPAHDPDIVLVPLLGFDDFGHRLGYGGGYYDRALARLRAENPGVQAVGVAYACQRVARLPAEAHDMRLDAVATEEGVTSFGE